MWIFTEHGFFSLTRSRVDPGKMQIRARARKDLAALIRASSLLDEARIITTPDADYCFRIIVTPATAALVMAEITERIDYPNFKSRIGETPGQLDKLPALHEVWHIMHDYQMQHMEPRDVADVLDRDGSIRLSNGRHKTGWVDTEAIHRMLERGQLVKFKRQGVTMVRRPKAKGGA